MHTGELIQLLVEDCMPVRPLPRPWIRTAEWRIVALLYVVLVVFVVTPRADLAAQISDSHFIVEQVAALATVANFSSYRLCRSPSGWQPWGSLMFKTIRSTGYGLASMY